MLATNVLLGACAAVTIFLGLPIARWPAVTERTRGFLALTAAGVVLFLVIEVGFQAMQRVELAALAGRGVVGPGLILVVGFAVGLVGLARFEDHRHRRRALGAGPLEVATMIAVGIGVHNFAEGLAIGQSFSGGAAELGTVLVIGFALHNATEGFAIAGPLAGHSVSWPRLLSLGLVGGVPTVVGSFMGGLWVNSGLELAFLALATGSLVYVTRELFRVRFAGLTATVGTFALTIGFLLGFATELVVDVGQAGRSEAAVRASTTVSFSETGVEPDAVSLERGEALEIQNDTGRPLIFEGNGLFIGEVVVSPGEAVTVGTTGPPGQYDLVDERGASATLAVSLAPGGGVDPLLVEKNAVGALTILEGHVRAAEALRGRLFRAESGAPTDDLRRAAAHAAHPRSELLHGDQPDALALQSQLREHSLLETFDEVLRVFVEHAGDPDVSREELDQSYGRVLEAVERARAAIGGPGYDTPEFRGDVIRFVLETAAGEYATAVEGGRIEVETAGVGGRDDFIEYQDARAFIAAARDLLTPLRPGLKPDARQAFDSLDRNLFRSLDPPAPDAPIAPSVVREVVRVVLDGLTAPASP